MIDFVIERYAGVVDRIVIVVAPPALPEFERRLRTANCSLEFAVQPEPTGMLPAVMCARPAVETARPDQVWISWCDQVGISAGTVERLVAEMDRQPDAALIFPTVTQAPPYIHFVRDAHGRLAGVLQRRDGDTMPAVGESDAGVFAMRGGVYLDDLAEYDRLAREAGAGERNFLPFIPWLARRKGVRTFELSDAREARGVNTPDDLRAFEADLRERE